MRTAAERQLFRSQSSPINSRLAGASRCRPIIGFFFKLLKWNGKKFPAIKLKLSNGGSFGEDPREGLRKPFPLQRAIIERL